MPERDPQLDQQRRPGGKLGPIARLHPEMVDLLNGMVERLAEQTETDQESLAQTHEPGIGTTQQFFPEVPLVEEPDAYVKLNTETGTGEAGAEGLSELNYKSTAAANQAHIITDLVDGDPIDDIDQRVPVRDGDHTTVDTAGNELTFDHNDPGQTASTVTFNDGGSDVGSLDFDEFGHYNEGDKTITIDTTGGGGGCSSVFNKVTGTDATSAEADDCSWEILFVKGTASGMVVGIEAPVTDDEANDQAEVTLQIDLSDVSGYDSGKTQVLGHVSGALQWIDTDTCE